MPVMSLTVLWDGRYWEQELLGYWRWSPKSSPGRRGMGIKHEGSLQRKDYYFGYLQICQ